MTDDETIAAYDIAMREVLDLLEAIVHNQWMNDGSGHFRGRSSVDPDIAGVLAARRPDRWTLAEGGLQWRPSPDPLISLVPFEHRGDGGADVT